MAAAFKGIERVGKRLLAVVLAVLLWRPSRAARAERRLRAARRILVVRVDDRVGEALLLTPLLASLKSLDPQPEVHVLVHPRAERLLAGHPAVDRLIPFARRGLALGPLAPGIRPLRREDYDLVIDAGNWSEPSVTHAVVARLVGPRSAVIGPAVAPLAPLRTHPVRRRPDTRAEIAQRLHLLSPLPGVRPTEVSSFRPVAPGPEIAQWADDLAASPHAVVNPGGRLGWRRVPPEAFAAACRALLEAGRTPVVTWGPGEEGLARFIVDEVPGARLAPPTGLDDLAALMAAAGLTVCNNTGPMHLSVAVGAPTLQLFLRMDPVRWGYEGAPHRILDLTPEADDPEALARRAHAETRAFAAAVEVEAADRRALR